MAHNLHIDENGKAAFVDAGTKAAAWHGLGHQVDEALTSADCIRMAGLDFTVTKHPAMVQLGDTFQIIPSAYSTVRTETDGTQYPIGVVGERYEIVQNIASFDWFDSIVGDKCAMFHTAGALGANKEKMFITAKLPDFIRVGANDDMIEKYLLLTNTHDGSGAIQVKFTPVRVVCQNTLNAALKGVGDTVSIRHTKNYATRLELAKKVLGISHVLFGELDTIFNSMAEKRMNSTEFAAYLNAVIGIGKDEDEETSTRKKNIRETILQYSETDVTQREIAGSVWGAYNAVTGYVDHLRLKDKARADRMEINLFGSGFKMKQEAYALAVDFTRN